MDFNKIIDRHGTFCTQWDYIEDRFGKGNGDITPFSISDTDFEVPQEIYKGLLKRINHKIYGYSRWNHHEYKGAIKNWFLKRHDTNIKEDWIVYSPSVLYSISLILRFYLDENNKKIMTHTPRYDGFSKLLSIYKVYDIQLKEIEKGVFITDFEKIENGFKEGVKVFLLCNPENPTGKVWSEEELKKLISLCKKYKVLLISDDIHMDILRKKYTPVLKLDIENCIIFSSPTKTFNTPALGGSYGIIPNEDLRKKFLFYTKEIDSVSSASILSVISTIIAYNQCNYWVDELNKYILSNCEYVKNELDNYKKLKVYIPEATYLMWIDFSKTNIKPDLLKQTLIKKCKIGIMFGEVYGDSNRMRLNVGCPKEKLILAVKGIKKALDILENNV